MKLMQSTAPATSIPKRTHSTKRQKVKVNIWLDRPEKAELERLAASEGLSLSRTGRALVVDGLVQKLRLQREALAQPAVAATMHTEMTRLINNLSQFQGRIVFEVGQLRWLVINKMYRDVLHPNRTLSKEEFYGLLDQSSKETMKNLRRFVPHIAEVVKAMKRWLTEEEEPE
jgi:hypothetical protein